MTTLYGTSRPYTRQKSKSDGLGRRHVLMFVNPFGYIRGKAYLCTIKTMRDGAVVAHWAHNPKVAGSSPAPATQGLRHIDAAPLII